MNPIIECLHAAVVATCDGRVAEADQALRTIDYAGLHRDQQAAYACVWKNGGVGLKYKRTPTGTTIRTPTTARDQRATFLRDHYTCRYSHCKRPTVCLDVLKLLSKAFPTILPYRPNWTPRDRHSLYWTYSTSLEHLKSFSEIGPLAADPDNLITACYECNDIKNYLPLEVLGWSITEPANTEWTGLSEFLPQLRIAVARFTASGEMG